jgi:hypothetical protein
MTGRDDLKIVARQNQPVKGYEQFESTTGADGKFRFENLFPTSEYTLNPSGEDWITEVKAVVETGLEEQTVSLPGPIKILFLISKNGSITDSCTGLMWALAPNQDTNWDQAKAYAQTLRLGGYSDWRLPTRSELRNLYKPSNQYNVHPVFRVTNKWVWTSEVEGLSAWDVYFGTGNEQMNNPSNSSNGTVLAVRFRK